MEPYFESTLDFYRWQEYDLSKGGNSLVNKQKQLPFLLQLLDDDVVTVRKNVMSELASIGSELLTLIKPHLSSLNPRQHETLLRVFILQRKAWLKENWSCWRKAKTEKAQIEKVSDLIVKFQFGVDYPFTVKNLLDGLAAKYMDLHDEINPVSLANFLFKEESFEGNKEDYFNPLNSNLVSVILSKSGIPISLVIIYMLLGSRVGLNIEGYSIPHYFLARTIHKGKGILVDCFDGGRVVEIERLLTKGQNNQKHLQALNLVSNNRTIIKRILQNLNHAYRKTGENDLSAFMIEILTIDSEQKTTEEF